MRTHNERRRRTPPIIKGACTYNYDDASAPTALHKSLTLHTHALLCYKCTRARERESVPAPNTRRRKDKSNHEIGANSCYCLLVG